MIVYSQCDSSVALTRVAVILHDAVHSLAAYVSVSLRSIAIQRGRFRYGPQMLRWATIDGGATSRSRPISSRPASDLQARYEHDSTLLV